MTSQRPSADGSPDRDVLSRLLTSAAALLFDFDGPVTRFFHHYDTRPIAREIKALLLERGVSLPAHVQASEDSHGLLHLLRSEVFTADDPGPEEQKTLELAEGIVTRHEYQAALGAVPDEHVGALATELSRLGKRLAIVSNNAEGPVRAYLERVGLDGMFTPVLGRDPYELRHMKPDPHRVRTAVHHLGLKAADCLLVGDQPTDLEAARTAGTPFLGYARSEAVADQMRREGAIWADISLLPLLRAASQLTGPN
ncbi:HAD family hydrolase [Streptomyces sp. WAC 01529]|uniref:HAD family hydrolase n=1 Tax=Streptomyces sp. WAC 01529 TaxID=2203205 RepID=UPI000F71D101|nr:HAD family phosphatase [Streptomyces sp. WAC 01529]AZM54042.1 HAD family hydrolase [Streptomyces sp. WAC 01529]